MAIGVDIEDIDRFVGKSENFYKKIFTASEIEYCQNFSNPESHFAGRFCAKEAVVKALTSLGIVGVSYKEIEVFHNSLRCPQIRILRNLEKDINFELSLSHDRTKAVAFVTAIIQ